MLLKYLTEYKTEEGLRVRTQMSGKRVDEIQSLKLKVYEQMSLKDYAWIESDKHEITWIPFKDREGVQHNV